MRPEYDFSDGVRGKHYKAYRQGHLVKVEKPDVEQPRRAPDLDQSNKKEYPISDPHQANRAFWDASTEWWKEWEDQRGLWMRAHQEPRLVLSEAEMRYVEDIQGVEVCVLGSGDNEVAFALAGLGGRVTSVDISEHAADVGGCRQLRTPLSLSRSRPPSLLWGRATDV